MTDTSTPAQRVAFVSFIENGCGDVASVAQVANCQIVLQPTTAYLIGLPAGATFAQASAKITARIAAGESALLA